MTPDAQEPVGRAVRSRGPWSLTRLARSGALGPGFNARSADAAALAQKLAALHPDEFDDDLAKQLRPGLRRKGVKISEVLDLLQDPTGDTPETYERARRLVELAASTS